MLNQQGYYGSTSAGSLASASTMEPPNGGQLSFMYKEIVLSSEALALIAFGGLK